MLTEREEWKLLNKSDFINRLAAIGYTKKAANDIITDFTKVLSQIMVEGESLQLQGFGTFAVKELAPRESVDYQSKEKFIIPAHKIPKFIPGQALRRAVKEGFIREE